MPIGTNSCCRKVVGCCSTLSTLMPGTMFCSFKQSTMSLPSLVDWYRVSSKSIAPEIYSPSPGVVHSSCRYAWRLTSVLSRPIDANRKPHVALDSSMARIPRPGVAIVFCKYRHSKIHQAVNTPFIQGHILRRSDHQRESLQTDRQ